MNRLLVHIGNIKEEILFSVEDSFDLKLPDEDVYEDEFNYNKFITDSLKEKCNQKFDLIYICLNLSKHDYLEMGGLIVALHIRLTPNLNNMKTPIVFLCQETFDQILRISELGNLLLTPGIFLSKDLNLKEEFSTIELTDDLYNKFLDGIHLAPPANYQSHHSIANEWALFRYVSAIKEPIKEKKNLIDKYINLKSKIYSLSYLDSLHFKYHEALFKREKFKSRKLDQTLSINGIEGKKIALIDDEYGKGWLDFYSYITEESGATIFTFTDFDNLSKKETISSIKDWFNNQLENKLLCDLYIIDLRLHDEDFNKIDPKELSGFILAKHLKKENPGIQILISTASDKVRNFRKFIDIGVYNYAIKESPETYSNKSETKDSINHLLTEIRDACSRSYLARNYFDIEQIQKGNRFQNNINNDEIEFKNRVFETGGLLYDVFYFLNSKDPHMIYSSLMTCFVILEEYSSMYGVFDAGSWKIQDKENNLQSVYVLNGSMHKFKIKYGEYGDIMQEKKSTIIGVEFFEEQQIVESKLLPNKVTDMLRIAMVLYYRNEISMDKIDRLFKLKYIRNNIAHFGNLKTGFKMSHEEINFIISDIFKIILM